MWKRYLEKASILVLAVVLAAALITAPTEARGTDNSIILSGDTVYLGEVNLDFSALAAYFPRGVQEINYLEEQNGENLINLVGNKGSIPTDAKPGIYAAYNATSGEKSTAKITIKALDAGTLVISDFNTGNSINPASVPRAAGIIITLEGGNINPQELKGDWNSFTLKNMITGVDTTAIKNIGGSTKSLENVPDPKDKTNAEYAFRLADQNIVGTEETVEMQVTFKVTLNGITRTVDLPFTVRQNAMELSLSATNPGTGTSISAKLIATPHTTYDLILTDTSPDSPYFEVSESSKVHVIDAHHLEVTPDNDGIINVLIQIPENAKEATYLVRASGREGVKEQSFKVKKLERKITRNEDGIFNTGLFSIGDDLYFSGTVTNVKETRIPVYLSITGGTNLNENGVNFEGKPVVDGDESTFTIVYYDNFITLKWEAFWDTLGFEPGSYTIHANLYPIGNIESQQNPLSDGYKSHLSWDVTLSEQSIMIRDSNIYGKSNYTFFASGSPKKTSDYKAHIRAYLIGENYKYTYLAEYDLIDEPEDYGKKVPNHVDSLEFTREFIYREGLAAGNYYIIVQHPGFDGEFDVIPDRDEGEFSTVYSDGDGIIDIGEKQSPNAAYALTELISKSGHDDLYAITELNLGYGKIDITPIDWIYIGETLIVNGTAAAAGDDDELTLSIRRLNFEEQINNEAMLRTALRTNPLNGEFTFDEIDTSTWFPGTYEATVTNIKTGISGIESFNVISPDKKSESAVTANLEPVSTPPPAEILPTPYAKPIAAAASKSPFPLIAVLTGVAAAVLLRRV